MAPLKLQHTIGGNSSFLGALAVLVIWGGGQFIGPLSPFILLASVFHLPWAATLLLTAFLAYPFLVPPESLYSPSFCRFTLSIADWLKGGASVWADDDVLKQIGHRMNDSLMICYHPHGLIPFGFILNGAVRARAQRDDTLPDWLPVNHKCSGIQAPILFRIPILRWFLLAFGCCVPATKQGMYDLLHSKVTFGIIPGGSEEVALHEDGKENLYILRRAGFIKYALRYGYTIVIAYTFGENDLYSSMPALRPINLWLVKRFGFVLPVFAGGTWWCPLLPRRDVPLNTVLGAILELPRIDDPTEMQVKEWHGRYVKELNGLFERHKAQFGYGERTLTLH